MKRIVCFGDSNTWGYNPETGTRFDENTRWTGRLQNTLGNEYKIIEQGLNSRTFANDDPWEGAGKAGIDYILPMMETEKPFDLLIIMLGTNDLKEKFGLSARNIAGGLRTMLMMAKSFSKYKLEMPDLKILVVAPPYFRDEIEGSEFEELFGPTAPARAKKLPEYYEEVAKEFECEFFDSSKYISGCKKDCLHMDEEGHRIMAEKLSEIIPEILS